MKDCISRLFPSTLWNTPYLILLTSQQKCYHFSEKLYRTKPLWKKCFKVFKWENGSHVLKLRALMHAGLLTWRHLFTDTRVLTAVHRIETILLHSNRECGHLDFSNITIILLNFSLIAMSSGVSPSCKKKAPAIISMVSVHIISTFKIYDCCKCVATAILLNSL